jgi:hypothetical protein
LIHHGDVGSRPYTSISFAGTLVLAGIAASIGSVADTHHSALAETTIGLFKPEAVLPAIHERIRTDLLENSLGDGSGGERKCLPWLSPTAFAGKSM